MYNENNDQLLQQQVAGINEVPPQEPHRNFWGMLADQARANFQAKRDARTDTHAKQVRELYDKVGSQLSEAMLESDETLRNISVDSILKGVEQIQRKPVSKEFKTWLAKSPDQAFEVLTKIKERGVDPRILFQTQDNPLLFAHGLLAMGKAKRELEARKLRGDGGAAPTESPSGPSDSSPEQLSGPVAEGNTTAGQPSATDAQPDVASILKEMSQRRDSLRARVNALAAQGRDEKEIQPIRAELFSVDKQIRDAQLAAPQAGAVAGATANVQPVSTQDLSVAVDAAKRAGRPEIAARFVPGMRRQAYDALVGQISGTTQNAATAVAPDASSASPSASGVSPYSLNQQAPNPARLGAMGATTPNSQPVVNKTPATMIQTPAESETEKAAIARREQKLPDDILRDPAVLKAGVTTQGEFEDGVRNGSIHMMDLNEKARRAAIAHEMGKSAVADFTAIKDSGNSARNLNKYYDILAASAEHAGPRGPWLTPVRETLNNFANLMAIKDPSGQAPLQLMNAISMKLVPELTKQFKGSQSDREFMAGIASAPSTYNSEKGFAVLLSVGRELNKIHQEQDIQARKWVAKHGDLSTPNASGDDFQTAFDKSLERYNESHGDLQTRVSKSMKLKPKELLKAK